jgi:hypothetical protein
LFEMTPTEVSVVVGELGTIFVVMDSVVGRVVSVSQQKMVNGRDQERDLIRGQPFGGFEERGWVGLWGRVS